MTQYRSIPFINVKMALLPFIISFALVHYLQNGPYLVHFIVRSRSGKT